MKTTIFILFNLAFFFNLNGQSSTSLDSVLLFSVNLMNDTRMMYDEAHTIQSGKKVSITDRKGIIQFDKLLNEIEKTPAEPTNYHYAIVAVFYSKEKIDTIGFNSFNNMRINGKQNEIYLWDQSLLKYITKRISPVKHKRAMKYYMRLNSKKGKSSAGKQDSTAME